jgi:endonuclease/exonuclease/phosphatase family metal-dependent hydrolase
MKASRGGPVLLVVLSLVVALALVPADKAGAVKVCTYNVLNWPGTDWQQRLDDFRVVMAAVDPDVIVLQEVESQLGVNEFLLDVLDYVNPGAYWMMPFVNGPDTDNACFYKIAVLDSVFHEQIETPVRQTSVYRLRPDGYSSTGAEFTILSTHLKAGNTAPDQADRLSMTTVIRSYLNNYPSGSSFMVAGDFNLYASSEGSYQMLIGYQTDNDGRCKDPINTGGTWHDNSSLRTTHTQSTRLEEGGLDDRYDFILASYALDDGDGLSYVPGSYTAFGNDGIRLNLAINDPPNQIVSAGIANALHDASDHLPVFLELQVPAKVGVPDALAFGSAIVGTTAQKTLTVANTASVPGDELSYTLTAPSGFTAPGGSFLVGAGSHLDHTITMSTTGVGVKSGNLVVSSNDLDHGTLNVVLSGIVVDHASPSLDAAAVVLTDTLDFGSAEPGNFDTVFLNVYNEGYGSLQALLQVYDAAIAGGDGRFSFVGGFAAETAGADPAVYELAFDSDGASPNTLYTATLTLSTRDDPGITGGTNLSDLTVHLVAYVLSGSSVPDGGVLALALNPGAPNPFTDRTTLRFALPEEANVLVGIYDVTGRIVRTLAAGRMPSGARELVWDGKDDAGADVASGIYFCRAEVGEWREARKVVLLK